MYVKLSQTNSSDQRFSISQWQSPKGFTLVELLISVAIIVIISSFGIASFNGASQRSAVKSQAQELKTLIRKMRTDAGAAIKPVTGATTATSCRSPIAGDSDLGIVYGSYINFNRGASNGSPTVTHGISCFDSTGTNLSSSNTTQLKSGLVQGSANYANLTVFFGFDGEVKFFSGISQPSKNDIETVSSLAGVNYTPIIVSDGANISSGNRRQVAINLNGLICDENVGTVVCAAP